MLRGNFRLLSLMFLSSVTLAASSAEATPVIDLITGAGPYPDPGAGISLILPYTPGAPVDLVGIDNDKFRLDVTGVVGTWTAKIVANDGSPEGPVSFLTTISSDGSYELAFSAFSSTTFTSINSVQLYLDDLGSPSASNTITVSKLVAVPEPATASMLGVGLLGLAAAAPRRRSAD